MDYPVVYLSIAVFQFGNIAIADENGLGKLRLRHLEGGSKFLYPFIDDHWQTIIEKSSQNKIFFHYMSGFFELNIDNTHNMRYSTHIDLI